MKKVVLFIVVWIGVMTFMVSSQSSAFETIKWDNGTEFHCLRLPAQ